MILVVYFLLILCFLLLSHAATNLRKLVRGANMTVHRVRRTQNVRKEPRPNVREIASWVLSPEVLSVATGAMLAERRKEGTKARVS